MQVFSSKIEVEARGITSTFSPLINPIFKRGENQMTAKSISRICSVDGCGKKYQSRGYCRTHYTRYYRHGDANVTLTNWGNGNTPEDRFWSKVNLTADDQRCWEWQGSGDYGYGSAFVNGKKAKAHRAAWYFVKGVWPTLHLLHSCDNRKCVNPNHLREGTDQDNADDAVSRGRTPHGEAKTSAKLTDDAVRFIQAYPHHYGSRQYLATKFQVTVHTISNIRGNNAWRHVKR